MDTRIRFRSFRVSDTPALAAAICSTWQMDAFTSKETSRRLAGLYLRLCLHAHSYACVAEQNGIPLGIVVVQDKRKLRLHLAQSASILKDVPWLFFDKGIPKLFCMQKATAEANAKMYKAAGKCYEAELVFFVLDEKSRGLGVGKALFRRALHFMRRRGIQNFFLYTDTLCNYGFYDAQGMRRAQYLKIPSFPYRNIPVTFFLYDMVLP